MLQKLLIFVVLVLFGAFVNFGQSAFAASDGEVIINEFSSASNPEWVELLNTTDSPISLSGWTLQDLANPAKSLTDLGTIPAHGLVVFENSSGWLNNDPDTETIALFDDSSNPIHSVSYGDETDLAAPKAGESEACDVTTQTWSV